MVPKKKIKVPINSEILEEACLEFDSGRGLDGGLGLSGWSLGFVAGLIGSDGRLEAGLELGRRPHDGLEGGWVERPDAHQVLQGELVKGLGGGRSRGEGVLVQQVGDERGDEQSQQLNTWVDQNNK